MTASAHTSAGFIYCLSCFYNLHGLAEHRCPECGRPFDPADASTFSRAPGPETGAKIMKKVASFIVESLDSLATPESELNSRAIQAVRTDLHAEIARLRRHIDRLTALLAESGVLTPGQLEALAHEIAPVPDALGFVVDDEEPVPEAEVESSETLEALGALVGHDAGGRSVPADGDVRHP